MKRLDAFLSNTVAKDNPDGYNFHILSVPEDEGVCRSHHLNILSQPQLDAFCESVYNNFILTNGDPRVFINERCNRSATSLFKFFIDVDFDVSESDFMKKYRNINLMFKEISRMVSNVYGSENATEMIVWGRDMMQTHTMKFHIHFPNITIDSAVGPDVIEYIKQGLQEVKGFSREELAGAVDIQPMRSGQIRMPLVKKIKRKRFNGNTLFSLQPNSEYFLYSDDLDILRPANDAVVTGTYVSKLIRSMILVFNDNTPITPSPLISSYRNEKYVNEENLQASALETNELISRILEQLRAKGINVTKREATTGRIIPLDSFGPHPCPVNPNIIHERENMYCTIKPDGVYVYCYRKECNGGRGVKLIDESFEVPVEETEFSPEGLASYVSRYGIRGGMDYVNKFWASYEGVEGDVLRFYYKPDNPNTVSGFNIYVRNHSSSLISCRVDIPKPTRADETRTISTNLGTMWQSDAHRRYISKIVFESPERFLERPEEIRKFMFNAFTGFETPIQRLADYYDLHRSTDAYKDDVFWFKRHIKHFWCHNESTAVYKWALDWLAFTVQHPMELPASALCLVGDLGTFKTKMFEAFWKPFFHDYYTLFSDENVITQWTMNLQYKMFCVWDEATVVDDTTVNRLKAVITGETLFGNQKHVKQHEFKNTASLVVITNDANKFKVDANSRRYAFLNTRNLFTRGYFDDFISGRKNVDRCPKALRPIINMTREAYYDHMAEEIRWENIISYLLFEHKTTPGFNTRKVINTTKLFELKIMSQSIFIQFLYEITQNNTIFESMENSVVKMGNDITYSYKIATDGLQSVIKRHVPSTNRREPNLGSYRGEIKNLSLNCIKYVEEKTALAETVSYFYLTDRAGIVEDLSRLLSVTPAEFD